MSEPGVRALVAVHGHGAVVSGVRRLLAAARARAAAGDAAGAEALLAEPASGIAAVLAPSLVPVVNATGVVIHTNLGRAPLPEAAAARVAAIASSYTNLEFDLATGERGDREVHAETRLGRLTGSEAALAVNNNAAAVLLAVNTFAEGRDVLVSRGELVEIGGSFRIPDVVRKGGGRLREVGTTNRTRISDYRAALSGETGLVLKVHRSNFRVVGFTADPSTDELVAFSRAAGVPLVEDLGSGALAAEVVPGEPTAGRSLASGVDVVTFSGDKLVGGPQAGLVVGRRDAVARMRQNALYRALRLDKLTIAALDTVLALHEEGDGRVPVLEMIAATPETLRARAEALAGWLRASAPGFDVAVVDGASAVGGGAAPGVELPTSLVTLSHAALSPDAVTAALRAGAPPVVARIADGRVVLDLRTVRSHEDAPLRDALRRVAHETG